MRLWWIHCVIFLIWNSFKKIFGKANSMGKKRDRKQNETKRTLPSWYCLHSCVIAGKKTKKQKMDDSHLILILQVGFFVLAPMPKVFCWWPPASFFYFFHAQKRKNPSASYLFNDGTTWAMSRWWICRMRQRARHQPRRNNCQHWVVVVASSSTHSVWCTKSNHLWNARKQIRTFLELNKAVLAWLGRGKKKIELQFTVIKSEEEEEKTTGGFLRRDCIILMSIIFHLFC